MADERYYILHTNRLGFKTSKGMISSKRNDFQVIKGEILCPSPVDKQPKEKDQIHLVSLDRANVTLQCSTGDVGRISKEEAYMLLAISSQGERYVIFKERKNILETALKAAGGEQVIVKVQKTKEAKGTIWYKGAIDENQSIFFGIELTGENAHRLGTCDGQFKGKTYFSCPANAGVFVSLDKIVKFVPKSKGSGKRTQPKLKDHFELNDKKLMKDYAIGTRVVVFFDAQNVRGTVRYVGRPRVEDELLAGVELEFPLGQGNGEYHGSQLFTCKKDYATFQCLTNILKEEQFYAGESTEESPSSSPSKDDKDIHSGCDSGSTITLEACSDLASISKVMGMPEDELLKQSKTVLSEAKQEKNEQYSSHRGGLEIQKEDLQKRYCEDVLNQRRHNGQYQDKARDFILDPQQGFSYNQRVKPDFRTEMLQMSSDLQQSHVLSRGSTASSVTSNSSVRRGSDPLLSTKTRIGSDIGRGYSQSDNLNNGTSTLQEAQDKSLPTPYSSSAMCYPPGYTGVTQRMTNQGLYKSPSSLEIESVVEVRHTRSDPLYGVIKWIGFLPESNSDKLCAGLELEKEMDGANDGTFANTRYFHCPPRRGYFTFLSSCQKDSRFRDSKAKLAKRISSGQAFGSMESPVVQGVIPPPTKATKDMLGQKFGIQGHHNSCYLDASLYSMFAFSSIFDSMLHRPPCENDLVEFTEVQSVLRDCIVNPLRLYGFVRADKVLQLRKLLDKLGSTSGLVSEEKDPEEFLNTLFHQVFKMEPLLHLKSAGRVEGAFFYQMFTEKDNAAVLPTVQQLLEQSFISAEIRLGEIPSCLILQMPRYGSRYKMYNRILPNLTLDITKIVENVPHECHMCGKLARNECKDCFVEKSFGEHAVIAHFCDSCFVKFHGHRSRTHHQKKPLPVPRDYPVFADDSDDGSTCVNYYMDLFAVVCIETSHYVAFVKCGTGKDSEWVFFDSMADRKGERDGYNIPCISPCPEIFDWIGDRNRILQTSDKEMPERMRRLFGDAYLCMYQNIEMGMYQ